MRRQNSSKVVILCRSEVKLQQKGQARFTCIENAFSVENYPFQGSTQPSNCCKRNLSQISVRFGDRRWMIENLESCKSCLRSKMEVHLVASNKLHHQVFRTLLNRSLSRSNNPGTLQGSQQHLRLHIAFPLVTSCHLHRLSSVKSMSSHGFIGHTYFLILS